jgi:hypothetical protein
MPTLRDWLAAHEAGHVTYVEVFSSNTQYAYIDDLKTYTGNMVLSAELSSEEASSGIPAAGAAGEFAYHYQMIGRKASVEYMNDLLERTTSDRTLFYKNIDYDGLVNRGVKDTREIYFIRYAINKIYNKHIEAKIDLFNAIRNNIYENKFIGRSMLDAIKKGRNPDAAEISYDYNNIPEYIRKLIRE